MPKERLSIQVTMVIVLEFLVYRKRQQEDKGGFSEYYLREKIPSLPSQKPARFKIVLDNLLIQGWVSKSTSSKYPRYRATEKGDKIFEEKIKSALEFRRKSLEIFKEVIKY